MKTSENINEIATALAKAQGELIPALKKSVNPHFKSKYADLADIWDCARETLSKHGLSVTQLPGHVDGSGWRLFSILMHSSGQWISSELPLKPAKDDNQGFGATLTYMRRYGLAPLIGIVVDEDDDGETADGRGKTWNQMPKKPEPQPAAPMPEQNPDNNQAPIATILPTQCAALYGIFNQLRPDQKSDFLKTLKDLFSIDSIDKIPSKQFARCEISLYNRLKAQNEINTEKKS